MLSRWLTALVTLPLTMLGCAAAPVVVSSLPGTASPATGTISGRPFVARSALLVSSGLNIHCATGPGSTSGGNRECKRGEAELGRGFMTEIVVFETPVTCAEYLSRPLRDRIDRTEDMVELLVWSTVVAWPLRPDTVYETKGDDDSRDRLLDVDLTSPQRRRAAGGKTAGGTMKILQAERLVGEMWIDVASPDGDAVVGAVPLAICLPEKAIGRTAQR